MSKKPKMVKRKPATGAFSFGTNGAVQAAERMLWMIETDQPIADLIREGDAAALELIKPSAQRNILRGIEVAKMWRRRGRQTLAIHPGLARELSIADSGKLPTDVLRALPYINPMVVYAEPPVFPAWEKLTGNRASTPVDRGAGDTQRLLGFFTHTHGYTYEETIEKGLFGDTDDPDAQMLAVLAIFEVMDEHGQVIDYECNTLSVPFGVTDTLRNFVDDLADRFYFDSSGTAAGGPEGGKDWLRKVMSTIVGTLFYLCSTVLEADPVPTSVTQKFRKTMARKPLDMYRIGWTKGAALVRYRAAKERWKPSEQQDIAHQVAPHQRCAHLKVVWTGKGRTVPKIAFVAPYWVHEEMLGPQGMNTVHLVPPDKETPAKDSIRTATGLRPEKEERK